MSVVTVKGIKSEIIIDILDMFLVKKSENVALDMINPRYMIFYYLYTNSGNTEIFEIDEKEYDRLSNLMKERNNETFNQ